MWQVGVEGCLCRWRCQGSLLAPGGGRKRRVSSLRFLLREGPKRVFASGKEPQGWDSKLAGVWCLQDPVKMGAAGGGTRLAGPWLVLGVGAVLAVCGTLAWVKAALWCDRN